MPKKPKEWDTWNKDKQWGYLRGLAYGRVEMIDKIMEYLLERYHETKDSNQDE